MMVSYNYTTEELLIALKHLIGQSGSIEIPMEAVNNAKADGNMIYVGYLGDVMKVSILPKNTTIIGSDNLI